MVRRGAGCGRGGGRRCLYPGGQRVIVVLGAEAQLVGERLCRAAGGSDAHLASVNGGHAVGVEIDNVEIAERAPGEQTLAHDREPVRRTANVFAVVGLEQHATIASGAPRLEPGPGTTGRGEHVSGGLDARGRISPPLLGMRFLCLHTRKPRPMDRRFGILRGTLCAFAVDELRELGEDAVAAMFEGANKGLARLYFRRYVAPQERSVSGEPPGNVSPSEPGRGVCEEAAGRPQQAEARERARVDGAGTLDLAGMTRRFENGAWTDVPLGEVLPGEGLPEVRFLDLVGCCVGVRDVICVSARLPALEQVDLTRNQLSAECWPHVEELLARGLTVVVCGNPALVGAAGWEERLGKLSSGSLSALIWLRPAELVSQVWYRRVSERLVARITRAHQNFYLRAAARREGLESRVFVGTVQLD